LIFEILLSGRVVPFGALLTLKNYRLVRSTGTLGSVNGFVASIFFDFFKVFLAILFPPRLICPVGHRPTYMQSSSQTSPPLRQFATCSICGTSPPSQSAAIPWQASTALN
jgi:hypothetical protein